MPRLSTCKGCGKKLQPNEKLIHSGKSYCDKCYEGVLRDAEEYKQLMKFICDNYEINKPTGLMLTQIKYLKNDLNYTYGGMAYTLWYCREILEKPLKVEYGVSLIKYYYEEAEKFYLQQEKISQQMIKMKDVKLSTKVIKSNKIINKTKVNESKNSLINIENLIHGGDLN